VFCSDSVEEGSCLHFSLHLFFALCIISSFLLIQIVSSDSIQYLSLPILPLSCRRRFNQDDLNILSSNSIEMLVHWLISGDLAASVSILISVVAQHGPSLVAVCTKVVGLLGCFGQVPGIGLAGRFEDGVVVDGAVCLGLYKQRKVRRLRHDSNLFFESVYAILAVPE